MAELALPAMVTQTVVDALTTAMRVPNAFTKPCPIERRYFREDMLEELDKGTEMVWAGFNAMEWLRLSRKPSRQHGIIIGLAHIAKLKGYENSDIDPLVFATQQIADWLWNGANEELTTTTGLKLVFNGASQNPAYSQELLDSYGAYVATVQATYSFRRDEP